MTSRTFCAAACLLAAATLPAAAAVDTSAVLRQPIVAEAFQNVTSHAPARHRTTARIALSRDAVSVAIDCDQPGVPLTATQTTNDVGFGLDDFAGIGIDTSGNGSQVYYFEVTPLGVRYQQASESAHYAPAWRAQANVRTGGWEARLEVPFAILRTQPSAKQRWRINVFRHIAALDENDSWAYDPVMSTGGTGQVWPVFGDARFWPYVDDVEVQGRASRPRPRAEVFALGSAGRDRGAFPQPNGALVQQKNRSFGVDVNVPLTGTLAFVGTLNPDFSNVEIDQQTIAPQEFRQVLTEYRPFFAQGAAFFTPAVTYSVGQPSDQLFYSPNIGSFDRGFKVEGTYGLQSLAVLGVSGQGFSDTAFAFKHVLEDRRFAYSLEAVQARHDPFGASAVAGNGTDTSYLAAASWRNLHTGALYGADFGAENDPATGTTAKLAYRRDAVLDVHRQNYELELLYRDVGPRWNPIDGFTNVSDVRGLGALLDIVGDPPHGFLKRTELVVAADRLRDRSGAVHLTDFIANGDLQLRNGLHLSGGPSTSSLRLYDDGLAASGYDVAYAGGITAPFNTGGVALGYKDGTPSPTDLSLSWGPFATFNPDGTIRPTYVRQYRFTSSRAIGKRYNVGIEFDGTLESFTGAAPSVSRDAQFLRRLSVGQSLSADSSMAISLRSVSGTGGFAIPGLNLAASYHRRTGNDELFLEYGSPAAVSTFQRVVLKYVVRFGGGPGV